MKAFFWANLLVLPTIAEQAPPAEPLPLRDPRFHYTLSKPSGLASARTRTLWVKPVRNSQAAQQIPLTGPAAEDPTANIVVRDVNFDGQPDLMITSDRGNVNSQYSYWLYNAGTKRFVINSAMSKALGGYRIKFDKGTRRISTVSRYSCCEHETRVYTFQQGSLKLVTSHTTKTVAKP